MEPVTGVEPPRVPSPSLSVFVREASVETINMDDEIWLRLSVQEHGKVNVFVIDAGQAGDLLEALRVTVDLIDKGLA